MTNTELLAACAFTLLIAAQAFQFGRLFERMSDRRTQDEKYRQRVEQIQECQRRAEH